MMDKLSEGISSAFNTAGTEANKAKLRHSCRDDDRGARRREVG